MLYSILFYRIYLHDISSTYDYGLKAYMKRL